MLAILVASSMRDRLGGIRPPGRCAPLMSPGPGVARPSSFTSLCTAPHRPDLAPLEHFDESQPGAPPRVSGDRRSEVKEEALAVRPRPGGMNGAGYPAASARMDRRV